MAGGGSAGDVDLEQKLNAEIDFARAVGRQNATATIQSVHNARLWVLVFLVGAFVSGGAWALFIVRGLNRQLRAAAGVLGSGAAELAATGTEVASASQSLAKGAAQQAASLEQTAASTEQLTTMTRKNAESSRLAADAMNTVERHAEEGNRTLEEMLVSMAKIGESSKKISKIIKINFGFWRLLCRP